MKKIGMTEQTVLNLLANSLFNVGMEVPENVDWSSVYTECINQAVVVSAWKEAKKIHSIHAGGDFLRNG